jgi:hypothetical protein
LIEPLTKIIEWLFSGSGASLIAWFLGRQKDKAPTNTQHNSSVVRREVVNTKPPPVKNITTNSEVARIVGRFNQVLILFNAENSRKYSIAELADLMKLASVGELESVFLGTREPPIPFIDHFCDTFGVSRSWILKGSDSPFYIPETDRYNPLEYLPLLKSQLPIRIYFIRSKSAIGEVFLVLKLSDHKYKVIQRIWHISEHVGAGGRSQIFGMYQLIIALKASQFSNACGGRTLPEDKFNELFSGNVFPGTVINEQKYTDSWWDDFTDVRHEYPISRTYETYYGKGFIEAQSIVLWKLDEIAKS